MIPLPGMFATIRSRLGVIVGVAPAGSRDGAGRTHLVQVEYKDDLDPKSERLVWELEPHAVCQHPNRLPDAALALSPPPGETLRHPFKRKESSPAGSALQGAYVLQGWRALPRAMRAIRT